MVKLQKLAARNCSFLWQRSRMRWLREGNANSKFFHRCIQKRRKVNEILGLNFDGEVVEAVDPLKKKVWSYFENHFKKRGAARCGLVTYHVPL